MLLFLWAVLALCGCGARPPAAPMVAHPLSPAAADALTRATEAFSGAESTRALRHAVDAALASAPHDARALDLAVQLAQLEERRFDVFDLLEAALRDPANPCALLHLAALDDLWWTAFEDQRARALYAELAEAHPLAEVRGAAAIALAEAAQVNGAFERRDEAVARLGPELGWSVIGTFDNDQGKGFNLEFAPERGLDPLQGGVVRGKLVDVTWRSTDIADPRGGFELTDILEPTTWQVAYLATAVELPAEGDYELRLRVTDPVKVWVNDTVVASLPSVSASPSDAIVVPVSLRAGANRLLVKSAHGEGAWRLFARLTRPGGQPLTRGDFKVLPLHTSPSSGPTPVVAPLGSAELDARRVAAAGLTGAAADALALSWANALGERALAADLAQRLAARAPKAWVPRWRLAQAAWDNQEWAQAAEGLRSLLADTGELYPELVLRQVQQWARQGLGEKARARLIALTTAHPHLPEAWLALAAAFEREGWHEDRLRVLREVDARWPRWSAVQSELADTLDDLRLYPQAVEVLRAWLKVVPNGYGTLMSLQWHAQSNDDFDAARAWAERIVQAWPNERGGWERLFETNRRAGRFADAERAARALTRLAPTAPVGWHRLAELYYQAGRRDEALAAWRLALERDPDNERVAHRLDFLSPEAAGPWVDDVPTPEAIDALVAGAAAQVATAAPGANVVQLLDDEVTVLKADGSTVNYVTTVAVPLNDAGRDDLTRLKVRGGGRARILNAFSVDPQGRRSDASTIQGGNVRFRQLQAGSVVVLQYRLDSGPDGYLASYMARRWWFAEANAQLARSRWVLWRGKATTLHEERLGPIVREATEMGEWARVAWSRTDVAPVILEPAMPPWATVASHVVVSTVPSWETFSGWEAALLRDAFRVDTEVEAVALRVLDGATSPLDKVERIHAWVMNEIRYQQDYEKEIAGVKPHPAAVTVSRRYGDCKDKAVLFITLARLAGIEAHFATVRTRDTGPVARGVPMQQFNHAIVYVPDQPGLPGGRFFDPTVEQFDVSVLRPDDQGTWSLVLDPKPFLDGSTTAVPQETWREVPYQEAEVDSTQVKLQLRLDAAGDARGELELVAVGSTGSTLRRDAGNPERLAQLMQQQAGFMMTGARTEAPKVGRLDSVRAPAALSVALTAPAVGQVEGETLRVRAPFGWSPTPYFSLAERRHDVDLGVPRSWAWTMDLTLPEGATTLRVPSDVRVADGCLRFERRYASQPGSVRVTQTLAFVCPRIEVEHYAAERLRADVIQRALEEQVVLRLPRKR